MPERTTPERTMAGLLALMAALRTPGRGCPWDLAQDFATIAPYTVEEAYEVADAIARADMPALEDELGDLLFQVVFHARMAEEAGAFSFADVVAGIVDKMVRRHPHVFGDRAVAPEAVGALWEGIKAQERAERRARDGEPAAEAGTLGGIARTLPALVRAQKLSRRAADTGFDWTDAADVLAKVREETAEAEAALAEGPPEAVAEEVGDLLFAVANLARHARVDPEQALAAANAKFARRFAAMEAMIAAGGKRLAEVDLPAMEAAWAAVKAGERGA
jgi:nucleoside triphosphate diphosphatase